ncbi:MAG: DUF3021 domain-containing protein [Lachnospiraceae bacterium]|nr:DUF3021 domain-containing protein [Lachnospiraceae bacterium]
MKSNLKKIIIRSLIGFALGLAVGAFFWFLPGNSDTDEISVRFVVRHFLVSGLFGAYAMGSTFFYEVEHWSITRATLTHFIPLFVLYFTVGLLQRWFTLGSLMFWIMLAMWLAMYAVIWLICYTSYRREIRKINRQLESWKAGSKDK